MIEDEPGSKWDPVMDKLNAKTSDDFAEFVDELRRNLTTNKEEWENITLDKYLEALSELFKSHKKLMLTGHTNEVVPYAVLARLMQTAAIYE